MLNLQRYGVVLRQIGVNDIENVRVWRNSQQVSRFMEFRGYITPEMQEAWYNKVTTQGDLYFIVECEGRAVGVANLKDFDWDNRNAEWGLFLLDEAVNSHVSYAIALVLFDYAFDKLGLVGLIAHVLEDNKRAIRYDVSLGFKPTAVVNEKGNRLYTLDKEDYFTSVERIRRVFDKLFHEKEKGKGDHE